jgi:Flp pilus assembly protein TadD
MSTQILAARAAHRFFVALALAITVFVFPAQSLFAASCSVVKHNAPTDADKAFLAADFAKAESLYKADVAAHPGDPDAISGLVRTLLREQKVLDAEEAVHAALDAAPKAANGNPNSAPLLTLLGEVKLRQGEPLEVEPIVIQSYKLDPCNPRTRLLYARYSEINSRFATARQQIGFAHQFDPEDPEIRAAWIQTLPMTQRIAEMEAYLSAPNGNDPETVHKMQADLALWKKQAGEPVRACRLVSTAAPADLPFLRLGVSGGDLLTMQSVRAFGIRVELNNAPASLQLGAGDGGLAVYRNIADHAGLKRLTESRPGGPGGKPFYLAYADAIKVGSLEFKDCTVKVIDSSSPPMQDDTNGLIGMDVFSDYLVTIDYPMRKIKLGPLPMRPTEGTAPAPSLRTTSPADAGVAQDAVYDRFVDPEMKDYTQFFRVGDNVILPVLINASKLKLFILDLGASESNISAGVAMDVTKIHERPGPGPKTFEADEITYNFAHMSQKVTNVATANTSAISASLGIDISGNIGANTFQLLTMHIDYRDGLIKFDYVPGR